MDKMPYRGVCSFDDLDILFNEYTKIIGKRYSELNKNIISPTEQEFKTFWEETLKKLHGVERCQAIYLSGKHKDERCRASPHGYSKYCQKHIKQDPNYKRYLESYKPQPDPEKINRLSIND
jgi:hypothetical protein